MYDDIEINMCDLALKQCQCLLKIIFSEGMKQIELKNSIF